MGRRVVKAGLAAGAALMLAACGGGSDPSTVANSGGAEGGGRNGGAGEAGSGGVKTAPLDQAGTLTVSFCHPIPGASGKDAYGLTLRSYSVKDGSVAAERNVVLPDGAEPASACGDDGPDYDAATAFNKDYTQVAVIVSASTDRAAAVDLATGKEISPPAKDTFSQPVENDGAAFHPVTGRLWYDLEQGDNEVASRDPKGGPSTEERFTRDKIPGLLKQDVQTAQTVLAIGHGNAPVAPGGGAVAMGNTTFGLSLNQVSAPGEYEYLTPIKTAGLEEKSVFCEPSFWRDATTLVCEFKQLTFSADYKAVLKTQNLVPENDRLNLSPVSSPDGKSFAFLSKGDDRQWGLFRGDYSGGQPVKIGNVDMPLDGSEKHRTSLLRWN
ncbi:hypothetical protein ACIGO8_31135 [Streptomyces sp. NPDC053493]|uniref:hypothetical protein n=1 Tax=Streptomyces sp. NPDC053493 TaxID=3365705 RepID=UPI0037D6879E